MRKHCECKDKKGFCLDIKIDFTKIVKYLCLSGIIVAAFMCLPDLLKDTLPNNEE